MSAADGSSQRLVGEAQEDVGKETNKDKLVAKVCQTVEQDGKRSLAAGRKQQPKKR